MKDLLKTSDILQCIPYTIKKLIPVYKLAKRKAVWFLLCFLSRILIKQ